MKLSHIVKDRKTFDFKWEGEDGKVTYRPSVYTPRFEKRINAEIEDAKESGEGVGSSDVLISMLCGIRKENKSNGKIRDDDRNEELEDIVMNAAGLPKEDVERELGLLVEWDITDDDGMFTDLGVPVGDPVPITPEVLERLPIHFLGAMVEQIGKDMNPGEVQSSSSSFSRKRGR